MLALTSIAAQTNASINGRLLARNGAVTLDSNTFTGPSCASATPAGAGGATVTSSTIPGTGAHALVKMKGAIAAVVVGAALVYTGRRNKRGGRLTVVTTRVSRSK